MDNFFFWLAGNPPDKVTNEAWESFLNAMALYAVILIAIVGAAIVLLYWISANRRKIHRPEDCFAPYTPMQWLWLEFIVFFVVGGVAAWLWSSDDSLKNSDAMINVALAMAGWSFLAGLVITYGIILIPGITPNKFRYRPLRFLYAGKGVKSSGS